MEAVTIARTPRLSLEPLGHALLFLMLVFQGVAELQPLKYALLALVLGAIGLKALKNRDLSLSPRILNLTLFFAGLSLFFVARGAVAGAPGAVAALRVYVFWPLIYLLLIQEMREPSLFRRLETTCSLAVLVISLAGINKILAMLGMMPLIPLFSFESMEAAYGVQDGYLKMESVGFNSLPFLVPYLLAIFVGNVQRGVKNRALLVVALLLGLTVVLLSGRRAILMVCAAAPLLMLGFGFLAREQDARRLVVSSLKALFPLTAVTIACFAVASAWLGLSADGMVNLFASGFDFSSGADHGAYLRKEQFNALYEGWLQQPLLGAGHGAAANDSIRNVQQPWAYELYYLALLYQTGMAGFLLYLSGVLWIYGAAFRIVRSGSRYAQTLMPLLVGMSTFLVASASNPYLPTFEGIWTIFLPLAAINAALLESGEGEAGSPAP